jgi:hypothetical protein
VNGGYFAGELTERHEYQPADASQPTVVTLRTYGRIGEEYSNQRVLLREEVTRMLGSATLSTEVTRYGYDERPWINLSTVNPYGTTNGRFWQAFVVAGHKRHLDSGAGAGNPSAGGLLCAG